MVDSTVWHGQGGEQISGKDFLECCFDQCDHLGKRAVLTFTKSLFSALTLQRLVARFSLKRYFHTSVQQTYGYNMVDSTVWYGEDDKQIWDLKLRKMLTIFKWHLMWRQMRQFFQTLPKKERRHDKKTHIFVNLRYCWANNTDQQTEITSLNCWWSRRKVVVKFSLNYGVYQQHKMVFNNFRSVLFA